MRIRKESLNHFLKLSDKNDIKVRIFKSRQNVTDNDR